MLLRPNFFQSTFVIVSLGLLGCKTSTGSNLKEGHSVKSEKQGKVDKYENGGTEVHRELHWGYDSQGKGVLPPSQWHEQYETCKSTKRQSPIAVTLNDLKLNRKSQRPSLEFSWPSLNTPFSVVNNRHTVQATATNDTEKHQVSFRGKTYQLRQFHYHKQSEHKIGESFSDLEIHFVHEDINKTGEYLVVGVLANISDDPMSKFTEELTKLSHLPPVQGEARYIPMPLKLSPRFMLPGNFQANQERFSFQGPYMTYLGSLTTPPCSESVTWIVLLDQITVSKQDIQLIHEARFDNPFDNARPPFDVVAGDGHGLEVFGVAK